MPPFRADRVALESVDPDPIPFGIIEIQQRHHFLGARELMVMVQLRRPRQSRAVIHHQQSATRRSELSCNSANTVEGSS